MLPADACHGAMPRFDLRYADDVDALPTFAAR